MIFCKTHRVYFCRQVSIKLLKLPCIASDSIECFIFILWRCLGCRISRGSHRFLWPSWISRRWKPWLGACNGSSRHRREFWLFMVQRDIQLIKPWIGNIAVSEDQWFYPSNCLLVGKQMIKWSNAGLWGPFSEALKGDGQYSHSLFLDHTSMGNSGS